MKRRLLLFFMVLIICLANTITVFATGNTYAAEDISALEAFLSCGSNSTVLGWDTTDPDSIDEVIWDLQNDGEYHIIEINLSNISVSGKADFSTCEYLEDIYCSNTDIEIAILPESIESLASTAFYNCDSLIYVELNSDSLTLGKNTFNGCVNLRTLLNTDCITSFGSNTFNNCSYVKFYGHSTSSLAKQYAQSHYISYSTNYIVTAYCYVGIMTSRTNDTVDLTGSSAIPYHTGFIETDYGTYYSNSNGKLEFNVLLGCDQELIIDGQTALTRTVKFDVLYNNEYITDDENAVGIVVCNYHKNNLINALDYVELMRYTIGSNPSEEYCYDINSDGVIDTSGTDGDYFRTFINTISNGASEFYTSWT